MSVTNTPWPQKTHDLRNHHFDSPVWDDFAFRDDDVTVATYAESGTTWTQQIVTQGSRRADYLIATQRITRQLVNYDQPLRLPVVRNPGRQIAKHENASPE